MIGFCCRHSRGLFVRSRNEFSNVNVYFDILQGGDMGLCERYCTFSQKSLNTLDCAELCLYTLHDTFVLDSKLITVYLEYSYILMTTRGVEA